MGKGKKKFWGGFRKFKIIIGVDDFDDENKSKT